MNRTDLMNACYKIRHDSIRESEKIEQLRVIAKEMVLEEKIPYVVFHWSESPKIKMNVTPFKIANSMIYNLNWSARQGEMLGYYKTKLDIYIPDGTGVAGYECLRYDIGCDEKDLIRHIQAYKEYNSLITEEEKLFIDKTITELAKVV